MIGFIDDLQGLLSELQNFCRNDIFCVTDTRVLEQDLVEGKKIFVILYCILLRKVRRWRNF